MIRTYYELSRIKNFEDRFKYLKLHGSVGDATFGFDRYMNQLFYRSKEWKAVRDFVIVRDGGCDLGISGREIQSTILVHHMNPLLPEDIKTSSQLLLNPEYLITTTHSTHNAIHYGDENLLLKFPSDRRRNDTSPWRQ